MEFKHFTPIADIKSSVTPSFPANAGTVDYNNLQKNLPKFEELSVQLGLNNIKGQIMKNTMNAGTVSKMTPMTAGQSANFRNPFPVFSNLTILGDYYYDNTLGKANKFDTIILDAVIMEVSGENNIITTDIQGRQGTVLEYVGSKAQVIRVTGTILTRQPGIYPRDAVDNLVNALESNKSLDVQSWWLEMFGIKNIIIKDYSLKQEEGSQEYQRFEFSAWSDLPVELKRSKNNLYNVSSSLIA